MNLPVMLSSLPVCKDNICSFGSLRKPLDSLSICFSVFLSAFSLFLLKGLKETPLGGRADRAVGRFSVPPPLQYQPSFEELVFENRGWGPGIREKGTRWLYGTHSLPAEYPRYGGFRGEFCCRMAGRGGRRVEKAIGGLPRVSALGFSSGAKITLRNGARIIEKTWPADD
jgi:hypothetical protein